MNPDESQVSLAAPPLSCRLVGDMAPLFAAKAKARAGFQAIVKDRHVKVVTREKGTYEFDYATLEQVIRCTEKALSESGLDLWHFLCDAPDGTREIHHMLTHSSGAFIETVQILRGSAEMTPQQFGSAVTYARRYAVQCILGVSAEFDDDGNEASGNSLAESRPRQQAPTEVRPAAKPGPARAQEPIQPQQTKTLGHDTVQNPSALQECSTETAQQIVSAFKAAGVNKGPESAKICQTVTGKMPAAISEADGQNLLAYLKDLAAERAGS